MFISRVVFLLLTIVFSTFTLADVLRGVTNPSSVLKGDLVVQNDKMKFPLSDYNKNGFRTWKNVTDGCYELEYCGLKDENLRVRGAKFNVRSNAPVPVKVRVPVSKKTVLANLLENAKKGKKIGGGWFGIAAGLVSAHLAEKGYEWVAEQQDFVKSKPNIDAVCIIGTNYAPDARRCVYEGSGLTIKGALYPLPEVYKPAQLKDIYTSYCNDFAGPFFKAPVSSSAMEIYDSWLKVG